MRVPVVAFTFIMKKILTKDKSITFYNPHFKEFLHPQSGALESVNQRYLNHLNLKDRMKILDIGFGIGYISLMILNKVNAKITGLEYDKSCINIMRSLNPPQDLKKAHEKLKKVKVLTGDARKSIKKLKTKFDLIILDAFSTMKNQELYSVNFFQELKERMKKSAVLITYNSSPIVRAGLIEAGFKLQKYKISKHEEGTIASFTKENLTEKDKKLIRAFGTPFYDPKLKTKKEEILPIQHTCKEINLV